MTARSGALLLLVFGAVLLRIGASAALLAYVNPSSRAYILVAGVVLVLVGAAIWLAPTPATSRSSRVGGLLLAPVLSLVLIAPPAQGALVGHRPRGAPGRPAASALRGPDPVAVTVADIVQRATWSPSSLHGHVLRVVGFLAEVGDGRLVLGRLSITCCAADAQEDDVEVRYAGGRQPFAPRRWLTVTGRFAGMSPAHHFVPMLSAVSVAAAPTPADPYD